MPLKNRSLVFSITKPFYPKMTKKKRAKKKSEESRKALKKKEISGPKGYRCAKCDSTFRKWKQCLVHMSEAAHFPPNWEKLLERCSLSIKKLNFSKSAPSLSSNLGGSIALETLRLLFVNFRGGQWPTTRAHLKEAILSICTDNRNQKLNDWFETCQRTQKKHYVLFKLEQQWIQAGCLLMGFGKCFWNNQRICSILETNGQLRNTTNPDIVNKEVELPFSQDSSNLNFVDTVEKLEHTIAHDPVFRLAGKVKQEDATIHSTPESTVAIFCESVSKELLLIQVATNRVVHVFDCVKLGGGWVCSALASMFANENIQKLIHNSHYFHAALATTGLVPKILGAVDTQLAMELVTGEVYMNCNTMLLQLGVPAIDDFSNNPSDLAVFHRRPLSSKVIMYAASKAARLLEVSESLESALDVDGIAIVKDATLKRFTRTKGSGGFHQICFDVANGYNIASPELMELTRPDEILNGSQLKMSNDINDLLDLLPEGMAEELSNRADNLSDVVMDLGRPPQAWIDGKRVFLRKTIKEVKKNHITTIVERLGGFGSGNRAGVERQLHRFSAMRNLNGDIIGVTMRVGRYIVGNADMVSDILCGGSRSVLFLGERGSGRTTVLRDVCRLLAKLNNVCVVDTSNDIAGDGDIPHTCIGDARRMMVPSLSRQGAVMIECVQNHTPSVMVIDEIGRSSEVEAVKTCKQRGVRMIASAHGDIRKVLENQQLRRLVGGVETVIVGKKEVLQRIGVPTFEVIVEFRRGGYHEWRIVLDTASAVDSILRGERYTAEIRTRDPLSGQIGVAVVEA